MESPYVWLTDVPEAERDTVLHRLAKGIDTAEGLPASLALWVHKVPASELGGQPQPPLSYTKHAYPKSMQPYPISLEYWREALHGRVDVAFDQNAVFWGHEGYLHVRVSQQQDDGLTSTGMPGRPSKGKEPIEAEFQRRAAANECEQSLAGEARVLCAWFKRHYPLAGAPSQDTIQNNIRARYTAWRGQAQRPTK